MTTIRIATRPSRLALIQTELAVIRLKPFLPGASFEILPVRSEGDVRSTEPLRSFGDKAVFVTAVEQALIEGQADLAVHSLKDLPLQLAPGLWLPMFLPREDPRDALCTHDGKLLSELAPGSVLGTSSLRRIGQLRAARPDLRFADIRGNVETRLNRLDSGEYDAIVLAAAGLQRLGLADRVTEFLDIELCTPAPGQGIVAVESRENTEFGEELLEASDAAAGLEGQMERKVAEWVGAACSTPFGCLGTISDGHIALNAWLGNEDGLGNRVSGSGPQAEWAAVAEVVSRRVLGKD